MEIKSKRDFFALWEAGVLGNRTRLWRDVNVAIAEARRLGIHTIGFREIRPPGTAGAGKWQRVDRELALETAAQWAAEGRTFILDDGVPDQHRTLQGEICRTDQGMQGFLEVGGGLAMRPAMAAGLMKHRSYLQTRMLLERYMDPSSRDDLDALLEIYPNAAIEFSCFRVNVGVFPGRNTIFWETRNY